MAVFNNVAIWVSLYDIKIRCACAQATRSHKNNYTHNCIMISIGKIVIPTWSCMIIMWFHVQNFITRLRAGWHKTVVSHRYNMIWMYHDICNSYTMGMSGLADNVQSSHCILRKSAIIITPACILRLAPRCGQHLSSNYYSKCYCRQNFMCT